MEAKIEKIRQLRSIAAAYALDTPLMYSSLSDVELAEIYNGAGPDWLPDWGRDVTTAFLSLFEAAFLMHDIRFNFSDGTRDGFELANDEMWDNMRKIINANYPLLNPFTWIDRARWWTRAYLAYKACQKGGWSAWLD